MNASDVPLIGEAILHILPRLPEMIRQTKIDIAKSYPTSASPPELRLAWEIVSPFVFRSARWVFGDVF